MAWMFFLDLDLLGQSEKSPTNFLPNAGNFHADESQSASNPFKKKHHLKKHSEVEYGIRLKWILTTIGIS